MTDSISNKNADRAYIREIQQEKNLRKKELADKEREEIKQVKDFYSKERKNVDQESAAAINHIKDQQMSEEVESRNYKSEERKARLEQSRLEAEERAEARRTASVEQTSVYNRQGRIESAEKKKPLVQNYQTKETDQFYQVQDRGSRISEDPNGYYIEAYVPEHEKDNVRLSITNDKAVLSGQRKFNDSVDEGQKRMATNNFQTFREEFKFTRPVSSQGMTREREGDYIRFFIPKMEAMRFDEES